jgi:hypothetical protein
VIEVATIVTVVMEGVVAVDMKVADVEVKEVDHRDEANIVYLCQVCVLSQLFIFHICSGLPQSGSWQDLKDHLRNAGGTSIHYLYLLIIINRNLLCGRISRWQWCRGVWTL